MVWELSWLFRIKINAFYVKYNNDAVLDLFEKIYKAKHPWPTLSIDKITSFITFVEKKNPRFPLY